MQFFKSLLISTILLTATSAFAQVCTLPTLEWLTYYGDDQNYGEEIYSLAQNPLYNNLLVAVGKYQGSIYAPGGTSIGPSTPYFTFTTPSNDGFLSLIESQTGFRPGIELGPTGPQSEEIQKAKFDPNGNFYYAGKIYPAYAQNSNGSYIAVPLGGVFNANPFSIINPTITPDLIALTQYDVFFSKLNANGTYAWTRRLIPQTLVPPLPGLGSTSSISMEDMAVDGSGNIYLAGYFEGTVEFNSTGVGSDLKSAVSYTRDIYVTKYNSDGSYGWTYHPTSTGTNYNSNEIAEAVAIDSIGNIYVTGQITLQAGETMNFGTSTGPQNGYGGTDGFLVKLSTLGIPQQAYIFGSPSYDFGNAIAVDSNNNIYIAGNFGGTSEFASTILGNNSFQVTAPGWGSIFLVHYDSNFNVVSVKSFGTQNQTLSGGSSFNTSSLEAMNLKINNCGQILLSGTFQVFPNNLNISSVPGIGTPVGGSDVFVVKLDGNGNVIWSNPIGTTADETNLFGLEKIGNGGFAVSGDINGTSSSLHGIVLKFSDNDPICGCP